VVFEADYDKIELQNIVMTSLKNVTKISGLGLEKVVLVLA